MPWDIRATVCRVPATGESRERGGEIVSIWVRTTGQSSPCVHGASKQREQRLCILCVYTSVWSLTRSCITRQGQKGLGTRYQSSHESVPDTGKTKGSETWLPRDQQVQASSRTDYEMWGSTKRPICMASADKRTQLLHGSVLYACMYVCIYTRICVILLCEYKYLCIFMYISQ